MFIPAENKTSMSVLIVGLKCTLATSHAATWWVTMSMRFTFY